MTQHKRDLTAERAADFSHCRQCGMYCGIAEYHPYAACLMFMQVHDGDAVRANLKAVLEHGKQQTRQETRDILMQLRTAMYVTHNNESSSFCTGYQEAIADALDRLASEGG